MVSRRTSGWIVLVVAAVAVVAMGVTAASATYVPGVGFELSSVTTCTPVGGTMFAPWHPRMADLNGDGIADIVTGNAYNVAGGLNVFLGEGGGKYSLAATVAVTDSVPNVAIADFNGDRIPDLVANQNGRFMWTMTGHGDGTFSATTTIDNGNGSRDAHIVDCDKDGKPDIVTTGSQVTLRRGDGAGNFGPALISTATVNMGNYGYALDVADIDGDGIPDVVSTDGLHGEIRIFRGTGGIFSMAATASVDGTTASWPNDVSFVQLDSDSRPEIVVTNRCSAAAGYAGKITAYDGAGPGFAYAPVWSATATNGTEQVEIGDVDQDGWDDVLVRDTWADAVRVFDNDGSGTLTERPTVALQSSFNGFGVFDADGDGRLDIIEAYGNYPGNLAIFDNTLPPRLSRVFGANRYATGAAASASAVTTSHDVVIATGAKFPDALSASGLCGALHAPLLLVTQGSLPASVSAEIQRLGAKKAWIIGDGSSVGTAVANALAAAPLSMEVTRVAGLNRYETSRQVAQRVRTLRGKAVKTALIARGDNFPDALAASPIAFSAITPIILTQPAVLTPAAGSALTECGAGRAVVLGSDKAVSAAVYTALEGRGLECTRVAGVDRYDTAVRIARFGVDQSVLAWQYPYLATGANFPDALAGGVVAGYLHSPLLLTPAASVTTTLSAELGVNAEEMIHVRVLGSSSAVSDAAYGQIGSAIQ